MPKKSQTTTTTKTSDVSTQPFSNIVQKLSEGVSYKDPPTVVLIPPFVIYKNWFHQLFGIWWPKKRVVQCSTILIFICSFKFQELYKFLRHFHICSCILSVLIRKSIELEHIFNPWCCHTAMLAGPGTCPFFEQKK